MHLVSNTVEARWDVDAVPDRHAPRGVRDVPVVEAVEGRLVLELDEGEEFHPAVEDFPDETVDLEVGKDALPTGVESIEWEVKISGRKLIAIPLDFTPEPWV